MKLLGESLPDLQAIYLYGSTATGQTHSESDIDLAVLASKPLTSSHRFDLAIQCAAIVDQPLDLVDLRRAPPALAAEIIAHGKLLDCRARAEVAHFETAALEKYCAWNEERKDLVDAIVERGSIYGR